MDIEKLIRILKIQSESGNQFRIFAYIIRITKSISGCTIDMENGNVYITKGKANSYPCIVAHMDTVHQIAEDLSILKVGQYLTGFNTVRMQQAGIGGDDKVGIFIALECLEKFENIKVAFFRDEETGCEGSYLADVGFFDDCSFVLQCDRKGRKDFITEINGIPLSSKKFQKSIYGLLRNYGYSYCKGLMTDVMALKHIGITCSAANISCGYYNPHTNYEYVNIADVENCLSLVVSIIYKFGAKSFPHEFTAPSHFYLANNSLQDYCIDCSEPCSTITGYCESCIAYYEDEAL